MPTRKYFTINQKILLVRSCDERPEEQSIRAFCRLHSIQPHQYREWKKNIAKFTLSRSSAKTTHVGFPSSLEPFTDDILEWIINQREIGVAVSIRMVTIAASFFDSQFRNKETCAKDQVIRRFVDAHDFVLRRGTHESQRTPAAVAADAMDYMSYIRPKVSCPLRQQRYILNMDQTLIFFSMHAKTTLDLVGTRTINIRASTNSTMRVTVAVTITASGEILQPMIVFKGSPRPGGRIHREFPNYPRGSHYVCQPRAWMDEKVMLKWVDNVLEPFIATCPGGTIPLLILDSYKCHLMASVCQKINNLGVEVEHIPGGCTSLCQPVDVGIGKPLKNKVRKFWEDWSTSLPTVREHQNVNVPNADEPNADVHIAEMPNAALINSKLVPPTRELLSEWIIEALQEMRATNTCFNSWRHHPYSYFSASD